MIESLMAGRNRKAVPPVSGSGALLVLVDSGGAYHSRSIVPETVVNSLLHWGLPFRWHDLHSQPLSPAVLDGCAGVVLAQEGLGTVLAPAGAGLLAEAVEHGVGLVSFDWDLRRYTGAYLKIFGFQGLDRKPFATNVFHVPRSDHFINRWQPPGYLEAGRMVTALAVKQWGTQTVPLVEGLLGKEQLVYIRHLVPENAFVPGHYPVAFAAHLGQGRAVQFTVNPRLWRRGAVGHLGGLDDLFWRAILWAVRKPFLANPVPPFVTFSFDDCSGAHEFQYLEILSRKGFTPLVGLFLDDVRLQHLPLLRALQTGEKILINSHGGRSYYDRIYYEFGIGEYPPEALKERFEWEDEFYRRAGLQHSCTVRGHFGEIGVNSLPFLKQRGRTLISTPILIGEHKADQFSTDGYWPYQSLRCYYEPLPDDPDFYTFGAFDVRHLVDFLTGATTWLRESPTNNVEQAAEQAAAQLRLGLNNGFYGEILTHESKVAVLTLEEWEKILDRTLEKMAGYRLIFAQHDAIGEYLRSREGVWFRSVERQGSRVSYTVEGSAARPLHLTVYDAAAGEVDEKIVELPVFTVPTRVEGEWLG